ncbi:MAG: M20 family metallopeptidase [Clostridia bacterium]|nr:M20 family metallopeptidase [Clostridia bacterium]
MLNVENVLEDLIKCNTIKDEENEKILGYIENILNSIGFKTEKRDKFLIMSNKEETSLGFLGHTDTVEFTDGWKYEKFALTKVEDKIYGLGVCDMKSGIAAIISAISQTDFRNFNKGMKLYFTYDEEIGFAGIKEVINYEKKFPQMMIIGEPTNNEIIVGSKGLMEYKISFKGIKTHSSNPQKGKNAIMSAISFINELNIFYQNKIKNNLDNNFEIPYTTMNIGKINGGSAVNSVPDSCEFLVDFRTINKAEEQKIIKELEELEEKYQAKVEELNRLSPFLNEIETYNKTCNFITEASFLENDRIILGAGPITAHEVNEYITSESLYKLVEQYKELIKRYCK